MTISLAGKTALVTGGSKGIGMAAALSLSEARAKVAICSRDGEELKRTAAEIETRTGHRVVGIVADVTSQADVDRLVQQTIDNLGGIDILVNNAGSIGELGPFEDISTEIYGSLYELNVVSMVRLVKAVLPGMKAKKWGRIINISSENGLQPDPDMMPYNLTKAAIINFSKSLSKSVGRHNILVNTVSPAFIYTPLVEKMLKEIAAAQKISPEAALQQFLADKRPNIELKRAGRIEEVGAAIAFLASEQASFITGTNLRVDGGSVGSI
ncbi:MAG TPA: SDR family oxidoreductase [Puia sp.]|jgi:NAD(P)-dependent dehydrogenase (short-subunit alcohol dehydrogenase family)